MNEYVACEQAINWDLARDLFREEAAGTSGGRNEPREDWGRGVSTYEHSDYVPKRIREKSSNHVFSFQL